MTILNDAGYITRAIRSKKNPNAKGSSVDWFIVRDKNITKGIIWLGSISIPAHLIGKKVRFRMELIDSKKRFKLR